MLTKIMLMATGIGMILTAVSILGHDLRRACYRREFRGTSAGVLPAHSSHWSTSIALGLLAWGPILITLSMLFISGGR